MDFKEKKAIYEQIAERICDEILLGKYESDDRIPSVREYAAIVEVNVNTVMRSFELLQSKDIIYNKRGIGFFVSADARKSIKKMRKEVFLKEDINEFFRQLSLLDIEIENVVDLYRVYLKEQQNRKRL